MHEDKRRKKRKYNKLKEHGNKDIKQYEKKYKQITIGIRSRYSQV